MKVARKSPAKCVPSVPAWQGLVALVLVVGLRRMVGLLVAADGALLKPGHDHALDQVGEVQRAVDFALQNREAISGPSVALLFPMDFERLPQLTVDRDRCETGIGLGQAGEAVPE